jgi:hypothetical protein
MVQLRFHPKMKWHGVSNLPQFEAPMQDDGILEDVRIFFPDHPDSPQRSYLEFFVSHAGKIDNCVCPFDDPTFIQPLCEKLKEHIGQPMSQIVSLDIDF